MSEYLVIAKPGQGRKVVDALQTLAITPVFDFGDAVECTINDRELSRILDDKNVTSIYNDTVPEQDMLKISEELHQVIEAWNVRHSEEFRKSKENRPDDGVSWSKYGREGII